MFYRCLKGVLRPLFYFVFGLKVDGKEQLNIKGKALIISNHRSNFDPVVLHIIMKRMPHMMSKKEMFKNPALRFILKHVGTFPVNREGYDLDALKTSFKVLNDGCIMGMYPEGTRSKDGELGEFHEGAAMIALRTKSPVIPVYISRIIRPFRRSRIYVGEPIDLLEKLEGIESKSEKVTKANEILYDEMKKLESKAREYTYGKKT